MNITFITPSVGSIYNNEPITSVKQMIIRTTQILISEWDNAIPKLNVNCPFPIGEINKYYVNPILLDNYNMLNFDTGAKLINIGYNNMLHEKSVLC